MADVEPDLLTLPALIRPGKKEGESAAIEVMFDTGATKSSISKDVVERIGCCIHVPSMQAQVRLPSPKDGPSHTLPVLGVTHVDIRMHGYQEHLPMHIQDMHR